MHVLGAVRLDTCEWPLPHSGLFLFLEWMACPRYKTVILHPAIPWKHASWCHKTGYKGKKMFCFQNKNVLLSREKVLLSKKWDEEYVVKRIRMRPVWQQVRMVQVWFWSCSVHTLASEHCVWIIKWKIICWLKKESSFWPPNNKETYFAWHKESLWKEYLVNIHTRMYERIMK